MYAGRIVEHGPVDEVLDRPLHPYTRGLIGSVPSRNRARRAAAQIPGMTPSLLRPARGLRLPRRAARAPTSVCADDPPDDAVRRHAARALLPPATSRVAA